MSKPQINFTWIGDIPSPRECRDLGPSMCRHDLIGPSKFSLEDPTREIIFWCIDKHVNIYENEFRQYRNIKVRGIFSYMSALMQDHDDTRSEQGWIINRVNYMLHHLYTLKDKRSLIDMKNLLSLFFLYMTGCPQGAYSFDTNVVPTLAPSGRSRLEAHKEGLKMMKLREYSQDQRLMASYFNVINVPEKFKLPFPLKEGSHLHDDPILINDVTIFKAIFLDPHATKGESHLLHSTELEQMTQINSSNLEGERVIVSSVDVGVLYGHANSLELRDALKTYIFLFPGYLKYKLQTCSDRNTVYHQGANLFISSIITAIYTKDSTTMRTHFFPSSWSSSHSNAFIPTLQVNKLYFNTHKARNLNLQSLQLSTQAKLHIKPIDNIFGARTGWLGMSPFYASIDSNALPRKMALTTDILSLTDHYLPNNKCLGCSKEVENISHSLLKWKRYNVIHEGEQAFIDRALERISSIPISTADSHICKEAFDKACEIVNEFMDVTTYEDTSHTTKRSDTEVKVSDGTMRIVYEFRFFIVRWEIQRKDSHCAYYNTSDQIKGFINDCLSIYERMIKIGDRRQLRAHVGGLYNIDKISLLRALHWFSSYDKYRDIRSGFLCIQTFIQSYLFANMEHDRRVKMNLKTSEIIRIAKKNSLLTNQYYFMLNTVCDFYDRGQDFFQRTSEIEIDENPRIQAKADQHEQVMNIIKSNLQTHTSIEGMKALISNVVRLR